MQENNISNSVSAPTVVPANDQQPKTSSFLVILLTILLFISVSIAGFFVFQTQKLVIELTTLKGDNKNNELHRVEPTAVSVPTDNPTIMDDNLESVSSVFESRYVALGLDPTKVKINKISLLGNATDKYVVSYVPSTDFVGDGSYVLIGKQNGKWIMPESGDADYCGWITSYVSDADTKSFMGPACKF